MYSYFKINSGVFQSGIFLLGGKPTADMPLCFVFVKDLFYLAGKDRVKF